MWIAQHFPGGVVAALTYCVIIATVQVVIWLIELAMAQRERWRSRR